MSESSRVREMGLSDEMRLAVLENLSDGVYFVDRSRTILYWNTGATRITGYDRDEVVGHACGRALLNHCNVAGESLCGSRCPLMATMEDGQPREAHVYLRHKDGHRKPVCVRAAPMRSPSGEVIGAVETFSDDEAFVDSVRDADRMRRASLHDPLTGAGNRRMGEALIAGWVEQYARSDGTFGLLFADVDSFKEVNDAFGHDVGDRVLNTVVRTHTAASPRGDQVIRWGGDEFIVLLADATPEVLDSIAERLRMLVEDAWVRSRDGRVQLTISVGATLAKPGETPRQLLRRTDGLLYRSKCDGGNAVTSDASR